MALVLHRTIHPVGQGAFYSEVFENEGSVVFTMVYDCGTETPNNKMDKSLNEQIRAFSDSINHSIDLLFVSHFHSDHINGLYDLTNNCRVRRTVIPMLTEEMVLLSRVRNLVRYGEKALPEDDIIRGLYYGKEYNDRFGVVEIVLPNNDSLIDDSYPKQGDVIISGCEMAQNNVFWKYIPFNSISPQCHKAKELKRILQKIMPADIQFNGDFDATKAVKEHLDSIKKVYKDVMRGANDNLYTLVVESSPVDGIMPQDRMKVCRGIYFGDFDYKSTDVRHKLLSPSCRFVYSNIGFVQVPHHGSKRNWNVDFLFGAPRHFAISAGTTNGYHHPSFWVVEDIVTNGNLIDVVSEKATSKLELDYNVM